MKKNTFVKILFAAFPVFSISPRFVQNVKM